MLPSITEVAGWAVHAAATIGVFAGSYQLASCWRTRWSLALFLTSIACLFLQGGLLVANAELLRQIAIPDMQPRAMEYDWKNELPERITEGTRTLAASHYVHLGRIIDYVALDGKRTPHVPAVEDTRLREQLQNLRLTQALRQDDIRTREYFLGTAAVTAFALGLASGNKRKLNGDA